MGETQVSISHTVRDDDGLRRSRRSRSVELTLRFCRNRFISVLIIAGAVSFAFHEVEQHNIHQYQKAVYNNCVEANHVRRQANVKFRQLRAGRVTLVDCRPLRDK